MKRIVRICRNCIYCDDTPIKMWCSYWVATIGLSRSTVGCSKFEGKEILEKIPIVANTKSGHND